MQDQAHSSAVETGFKPLQGKNTKIAIIDDGMLSSESLVSKLNLVGEHPIMYTTENRDDFLSAARAGKFQAIIIGSLYVTTPIEELRFLYENNISLPVIMANNHFDGSEASDALKQYVVASHIRPVHYECLLESLNKVREKSGLKNNTFESAISSEAGTPLFRGLVGDSQAMRNLRDTLTQLENKSVTVLICGEEGTGMEIVARNLHYGSGRQGGEFIAVNCAALSAEMAVVDLFGVEAGYNKIEVSRPGHIERANRGTLFLDKVDELPLDVQARLFSFMETGVLDRVGGHKPIESDVRIIAGSNLDLEDCVKDKSFRKDLYYLLNVFPINMPALRERSEDIPDLVNELVSRLQHQDRAAVSFEHQAIQSLQNHYWQGNIRELANLVERLSIVKADDVVSVEDLPMNYRHVYTEPTAVETPGGDIPAIDNLDSLIDSNNKTGMLRPVVIIDTKVPLTSDSLKSHLEGFARDMIEVALDDAMSMDSFAADRLNLSLEEFADKRRHFDV